HPHVREIRTVLFLVLLLSKDQAPYTHLISHETLENSSYAGDTPQVRAILKCLYQNGRRQRITPACAGNTYGSLPFLDIDLEEPPIFRELQILYFYETPKNLIKPACD
ncbi:hypothetical protein, partial [Lactobacillus iners]|uniref:hypothetical protein n=1 Tax=Lactobacillus iners TaxID=147802 RepID=UPI0039A6F0F0